MSRIRIPGKELRYRVVVGWDNPMGTFYAQVYDLETDNGHEPVMWTDKVIDRVDTIEHLLVQADFIDQLHPKIKEQLNKDRDNSGPITPLQKRVRSIFEIYREA